MTAKQKASELLQAFVSLIGSNCENYSYCQKPECKFDGRTTCKVDLDTAKNCALRAVVEIMAANPHSNPLNTVPQSTITFWSEVKSELEKL